MMDPKPRNSDEITQTDRKLSEAHLIVLEGGAVGQVYRISTGGVLSVGRDPESDIPLTADSVSRRHAEIEARNGHKVWICDLGSRNGVEVDEHKILGAHRLRDGEIIRMGQAKLRFVDSISLESAHEEKLFLQATRDPLTGLYNRRFMKESLIRMLTEHERRESSLAMVLMDLDEFHKVNEEHGKEVADKLLCRVANELRAKFRNTDLIARYGGDEFVILLPDTDADIARKVIEKIQDALRDLCIKTNTPRVTICAGASGILPQKNACMENLAATVIKKAEEAVYMAKLRGRNHVVGFG